MQKTTDDIIIFLVVVSALITCMVFFIVMMLYLYRKKQTQFQINLAQLQLDHEKSLMNTKLEIQEQTFQHISREIHDNINLSLTLAKLHLNTFNWNNKAESIEKLDTSINLLTSSIAELSDISKSLNADLIIQNGILRALEEELQRIRSTGLYTVEFDLTGTPLYLDHQKELIIFRIIQESFNNIIKHAEADTVWLTLEYQPKELTISIRDNGIGFDNSQTGTHLNAGLKNMETRIKILQGSMQIISMPKEGATLLFTIPYN